LEDLLVCWFADRLLWQEASVETEASCQDGWNSSDDRRDEMSFRGRHMSKFRAGEMKNAKAAAEILSAD
jgi:hypothetical protein